MQPVLSEDMLSARSARVQREKFEGLTETPDLGQDPKYKLFPFQVSWHTFDQSISPQHLTSLMDSPGFITSGKSNAPVFWQMKWDW